MSETKSGLAARLLKSSSVYALSGLLRNAVSFVMLPVYTRYLSPEDYGIVALMVFVVSLIEITMGARMGHAPQKFYHDQKHDSDRKLVIASALFTTSAVSLVVTLIAVSQSDVIASLVYDDKGLSSVVGLFLILITTQAIEALGLIYIRIQNRYLLFFWLSVLKLFVQVSANVFLVVYLELGVLGMATATAFSAVLFAGIVLLYVVRQTGFVYSKALAWKMIVFTAPLWVSGLVSLYVGSSNLYVMNAFVELEEIGLYSIAERLGALIVVLLFTPFFNFWSAERFRLKDRPDFDHIHQTVFLFTYVLLISAGLAICLFGDFILAVLTTESFHGAEAALPFLILGYTFSAMNQFYQYSFLHREKTGQITRIFNWVAVATTIFNFSLIPLFGYVGASISVLLSNFTLLMLSHFRAKPFYDSGFPIKKLVFSSAFFGFSVTVYILLELDSTSLSGFGMTALYLITSLILLMFMNFTKAQWQQSTSFLLQRFKRV